MKLLKRFSIVLAICLSIVLLMDLCGLYTVIDTRLGFKNSSIIIQNHVYNFIVHQEKPMLSNFLSELEGIKTKISTPILEICFYRKPIENLSEPFQFYKHDEGFYLSYSNILNFLFPVLLYFYAYRREKKFSNQDTKNPESETETPGNES